jgi:hypothetical protein
MSTHEQAAPRRWLEDPHLSLDTLSPGQRYTALIALGLAIALLLWGVPRGHHTVSTTELSVPQAVGDAGLLPAPSAAPATTADIPLAAFPSAAPETTTTMAAPPAYQPAPAPPPSESPSTTSTTAPPASPLPIPGVTIP